MIKGEKRMELKTSSIQNRTLSDLRTLLVSGAKNDTIFLDTYIHFSSFFSWDFENSVTVITVCHNPQVMAGHTGWKPLLKQ